MNIKLGEHIVILCSFIHQLLSNRYKLITNVRSSLMAVNIHITIIELNALHTKRQNLRSEERFSRNAETDLVCRLLLEKKNGRNKNNQSEDRVRNFLQPQDSVG